MQYFSQVISFASFDPPSHCMLFWVVLDTAQVFNLPEQYYLLVKYITFTSSNSALNNQSVFFQMFSLSFPVALLY